MTTKRVNDWVRAALTGLAAISMTAILAGTCLAAPAAKLDVTLAPTLSTYVRGTTIRLVAHLNDPVTGKGKGNQVVWFLKRSTRTRNLDDYLSSAWTNNEGRAYLDYTVPKDVNENFVFVFATWGSPQAGTYTASHEVRIPITTPH